MARKNGKRAQRKTVPKSAHQSTSKKGKRLNTHRATSKLKSSSKDIRKSSKQVARTAKTLSAAVKKVSKTFAKTQQKKADARELAQINRLLDGEYTNLSAARRALKKESTPVSERTFVRAKRKAARSAAKPAPLPSLKYPHPSTRLVVRYARKHDIPLHLGMPNYQATYEGIIASPQFQASYEVMEKKELQTDKSPRGRFAQALVDFDYRDDDADYDVGDTPGEEAA